MWSHIEGIVLSVTPLQSQHKILKVFSKEKGLISFVAKYIHCKKKNWQMILSPFSQSEFIYRPKSELHTIKDASLIDAHLHLRTQYDQLQSAGKMARTLLLTHYPEETSASVYILFEKFLKALSIFPSPDLLAYSFLLRFLRLEGLLDIQSSCHQCQKNTTYIYEGQGACASHTKTQAFPLSKEEFQQIFVLSHAKQFSMMHPLSLKEETKQKIDQLFLERIA